MQQNIHLQAIYAEREYLDALIKRNQLSRKVASQLRENINYNEIVFAEKY